MAIIPRIIEEGKKEGFKVPEGALMSLVVILACSLSFGLGFLTGKETGGGEVRIETLPKTETIQETTILPSAPRETVSSARAESEIPPQILPSGGQYVASKKGTKYHLPWCPGAKQMKEENKIWFASKAEAEQAGYTPASNCKGI